jgi:TolB-like protein/Flp pilus assembly protein TadD
VEPAVAPSRAAFRVGEWTVHPDTCRLTRTGEDRFLRPKLVDLLVLLARHPSEVLTKDQILDQVWHSRFVSESALTRNIAELRQLLDDRGRPVRYVETIRKRGYRLVADVAGLRPFLEPTLAVIPFTNLNRDPEEDYFADGITDAIITELGRIGSLRVISRQSVLRYRGTDTGIREIAGDLGVDNVLEGSALHAGSRVRIAVQLIAVEPERHLWAERFDCELTDILPLQARVARAVAEKVHGVLTPGDVSRLERKVSVDPAAHVAYLRARHLMWTMTEESVRRGLEYVNEAIRRAPDFAPAYGVLADSLATLGFWGFLKIRETYPRAKQAALRALELDASHAESRTALGMILWHLDWDLDGAERELRRAVELGPSNEVAHLLLAMFLVLVRNARAEAIEHARIAWALDPLSLATNVGIAWFRFFIGEYGAAVDQARRTLEMHPHALHAHYVIGWTSIAVGDCAQAIAAFERAVAFSRDPMSVGYLAVAHARAGNADAARELFGEMKRRQAGEEVPAISLAMVAAALGARDEAFAWLAACREERDCRLFWLPVPPFFDALADDPRFHELVRGLR